MRLELVKTSFKILILQIFSVFFLSLGICFFQSSASAWESSQANLTLSQSPELSHFPIELAPLVRLLRRGDSEKAPKFYQEAIAQTKFLTEKLNRGNHDELYYLSGYAHEKLGEEDLALADYEASLKLRTTNMQTLARHAALLVKKKNCTGALPEFREILWRTQNGTAEINTLTAHCYQTLGQEEKARAHLRAAYQANPHYLPALKMLTKSNLKALEETLDPFQRDLLEAETLTSLAHIHQNDSKDRQSALLLTKLLLKKSDPLIHRERLNQAELVVKSLSEKSAYRDDEAVKLFFDVLLKSKKYDEAEKVLKRGLRKKSKSKILRNAEKQLELERSLLAQRTANDEKT